MGAKHLKKAFGSKHKQSKREWLAANSNHQDTGTVSFVSPICNIVVGACQNGIHSLSWKVDEDSNAAPTGYRSWGEVVGRQGSSCTHLDAAVSWLRQYFRDPHCRQKPPQLCFAQVKGESCIPIWRKLADEVGPGQTISYGGLAKLCGNPKASRHVGYAMGHNPFPLLVPCHRVVTSSGAVGNYCHGRKNWVKEWLHNHERAGGLATEG